MAGQERPDPWRYLQPKVFIAYPHNPVPYVQIAPPNVTEVLLRNPGMMEEEVRHLAKEEILRHAQAEEKAIEANKKLVYRFAQFLQKNAIIVSYDQMLTDTGASNLMKWSQQQIEDSDFVILIVTPSLCDFLSNEVPAEEEYLFVGDFLYNLIHNPPANKPLLPVFLERMKDIGFLPKALEASTSYEIWQPFSIEHTPRNDDLESLYARLTGQNRYEQPKPPPSGPVKLPPRRKRLGAGVKAPSEMKPVHHQLHLNLSQRHHPLNDTSTAFLSQNETFSTQWEQLAGHLGLTEADVEHCREHGCGDREEACHQMLRTWKNHNGSQATVARLANAILQIRDSTLLELLNVACTQ